MGTPGGENGLGKTQKKGKWNELIRAESHPIEKNKVSMSHGTRWHHATDRGFVSSSAGLPGQLFSVSPCNLLLKTDSEQFPLKCKLEEILGTPCSNTAVIILGLLSRVGEEETRFP